MADEQGTGKHPHKSAAEPFEHHEGKSTTSHKSEGNGASHASSTEHKASTTEHKTSSKSEHSTEEGTGKHPHKKASDPKEHHEGAKK